MPSFIYFSSIQPALLLRVILLYDFYISLHVYFLQGHSRHILVRVKPVANSGTLPLICEAVTSLSIGCLVVRNKMQKGLDSYQEEDLNALRERWAKAVARRKEYLDEHIQKLINKQGMSLLYT